MTDKLNVYSRPAFRMVAQVTREEAQALVQGADLHFYIPGVSEEKTEAAPVTAPNVVPIRPALNV